MRIFLIIAGFLWALPGIVNIVVASSARARFSEADAVIVANAIVFVFPGLITGGYGLYQSIMISRKKEKK